MNLRKYAQGQPCKVRLPGCDGGGATTVLAHYRIAGYCGTAFKPDDLAHGAWCCFPCHEAVDGRRTVDGYTKTEIRLAHSEGVQRTIAALRQEGKV